MTRSHGTTAFDQMLDDLAELIADKVVERVASRLPEQSGAVDYYDQHCSPLGKRRFLDEARRGSFPSVRRGKLVLALRSEVDGWLAGSMTKRAPANDQRVAAAAAEADADDLLEKAGVIPGGPARCRSTTRRR